MDEVHEAMHRLEITSVKLKTIRYCLEYSAAGPGFYAGISIIKRGPRWSGRAISCASTVKSLVQQVKDDFTIR